MTADGWSVPRLDASYSDPDCGCPVEEWVYRGLNFIIHFEYDGSMEAFVDAGDWDFSLALKASTMEGARQEAFAWADALPVEGSMKQEAA